jgi:hypothetical protein
MLHDHDNINPMTAMQFIATVVALVISFHTRDHQPADGISEQSKGTVTQYRVFENETGQAPSMYSHAGPGGVPLGSRRVAGHQLALTCLQTPFSLLRRLSFPSALFVLPPSQTPLLSHVILFSLPQSLDEIARNSDFCFTTW